MSQLLLVTSDFSPQRGGVARYYSGLYKELGVVTVLTCVRGSSEPGVTRTSWHWLGWPHWLPLLWVVPYFKFKIGAKILAAGEILPVGTALWLMRLAFGWQYLVFVHGFDVGLTFSNPWKQWLSRQILHSAKLVVANSQFTKNLAIQAGAVELRTRVVYPCSDLNLSIGDDLVSKLKITHGLQGKKIILSVARLVKRKGIANLINTISELQKQFPDIVYVVVGDGPERNNLENLAKNNNIKILFTGEVNDSELAAWYKACDIFALVPLEDKVDIEGFGIVYLEAQASGKPIIARDTGGIVEAVGDGGIIIKNDNELKTALVELLSNEEKSEKLGKLGRLRISTKFNWHIQAEALKEFLRNN